MKPDEEERRKIADRAVEKGQRLIGKSFPELRIHWDDCNEGGWTFWIHIRHPGLLRGSKALPSLIASKIRAWHHAVEDMSRKSEYQIEVARISSPEPQYRYYTGRRHYDGCRYDKWVYALKMTGGPDAVVL